MATRARVTAPELEQFIVATVQLTGRVLGVGSYGSVEEVEIPGATVVAKKLPETLVNLGSPQQVGTCTGYGCRLLNCKFIISFLYQVEKWVRDLVEECKLMSQLRHPHIVQFLGVCYLPGAPLPVLLMEKLLTSLDNLLETSPNIPVNLKVYFLVGTSRGLVYLHSHTPPIAHQDLSAKNILVDNGLNAKIADLGVSRIVNVRPGQLAVTMIQMPGIGVYMPPEAGEEEGATRYNTGIDIFSLGVVSLFTLTQTFPKDLKPATYFDPTTRSLVARSEIERREDYIVPMKASLGEAHPLVKLTLDCLKYDREERPSAVVVLRRLEEVESTLPQNCTQTKLQLIQEIYLKNEEIDQINQEIIQKDMQITQLKAANNQLKATVDRLQVEKQEQYRKVASLSDEMQLLQIKSSGQREVTAARVKVSGDIMLQDNVSCLFCILQ